MANTNAPNGFVPYMGPGGTSPNFETTPMFVASNNATKIYKGDPVKQLASNYVGQWTASTGASQLAGIFWGCKYNSVSQSKPVWSTYWPGADATGDVTAFVFPLAMGGTMMRFLVQSSGTAIARVGQNADVSIGTGSTLSGISGASLDQTTLATTATLPFRVVGLMDFGTNVGVNGSDTTTSYNRVVVEANILQMTGI